MTSHVYAPHAHEKHKNDELSKQILFKQTKTNIALLVDQPGKTTRIIESSSSLHISNSKEIFTKMTDVVEFNIIVANGNKLTPYGSGEANIHIETSDGKAKQITLKEVLYRGLHGPKFRARPSLYKIIHGLARH